MVTEIYFSTNDVVTAILGKWFGYCNDVKSQLDRCFKEEKEVRRRANAELGREQEKRLQRIIDSHNKVDSSEKQSS